MAMIMPRTTCKLRPSLPKNKNPRISTRMVFIWPRTWNETAVNLPMQMNWLRLVPTAIVHERIMKTCRSKGKESHERLYIWNTNTSWIKPSRILKAWVEKQADVDIRKFKRLYSMFFLGCLYRKRWKNFRGKSAGIFFWIKMEYETQRITI